MYFEGDPLPENAVVLINEPPGFAQLPLRPGQTLHEKIPVPKGNLALRYSYGIPILVSVGKKQTLEDRLRFEFPWKFGVASSSTASDAAPTVIQIGATPEWLKSRVTEKDLPQHNERLLRAFMTNLEWSEETEEKLVEALETYIKVDQMRIEAAAAHGIDGWHMGGGSCSETSESSGISEDPDNQTDPKRWSIWLKTLFPPFVLNFGELLSKWSFGHFVG